MTTTSHEPVTTNEATATGAPVEMRRPVLTPAADVIDKADSIHVLLDLPGVDQKGLDVTVEEHTLTVRGRSAIAGAGPGALLREEFPSADFERTFRLGPDIDESRIGASLRNGTLRLVLPKAEKARPKQISVQAE